MEKTYHLDLKTLLEFIRGKSAILRTTVTLPRQRNACQGALYLKGNGATHCFIFTQEGMLLMDGANAHATLSTCTEWLVRLDTEHVVETELLALARRYPLILGSLTDLTVRRAPRLKNPLTRAILQRFSVRQSLTLRTVLAMVNGARTVEQIKAQLNLPPELIDEALEVLHNINIIE